MNSLINYRNLTVDDKQKYREIRLDCLKNFPQNFGSLYEQELVSPTLKFDAIISHDNGTDFLLGAFDGDDLIGICGNIQQHRSKTEHITDISHLYVKPPFANKGIASELLRLTIEKVFSNSVVEQILLGVVESNSQAIKLYEKFDFTEYGYLENYYKSGEEYEGLVLMVLKREMFERRKL